MQRHSGAFRATPCDRSHVNKPAKRTLLTDFAAVLANVLIGLRMDPQQDMDCLARKRVDSHRRSRVGLRQRVDAALRSTAALSLLVWSSYAAAIGTGAGARIDSTAHMTFDVAGVAQPIVASNTVTLDVNEVLDAVVVSQDAAAVSVASGATGAWLSFSVTNTGNGSEPFRLVVDAAITGDDFDPTSPAIYIETNGTPGLQIGAGGDTPYVDRV